MILQRYVLVEVIKVFAVSVLVLTLIVVLGFVGREAMVQGLPLLPTLRLVPYFLPETLRITVPMTLLLACTTVFSRMSTANEIFAVKAVGVSPMVLLRPVFIFAFLMSLVTVWLNDAAESWGHAGIQRAIVDDLDEIIYCRLQSQRRYSSNSLTITVKNVEGRRLGRVTLVVLGEGASPKTTITAEEAVLKCDREKGVLKVLLRNSVVRMDGISMVWPGIQQREIALTDASRADPSVAWNLPLRRLPGAIADAKSQIEESEERMAAETAFQMTCGEFDELTSAHQQWLFDCERRELSSRYFRLLSVAQRRWAGGFACLCFALVGAPLAIRLRNRDSLTSFFLCFLPILVIYYPLMIYGTDAAKNGSLPAAFVWVGNAALVLCGALLLRLVVRY